MNRVALPPRFVAMPLAHRALHDVGLGRPENSRAAVIAAIAAGYGIEIDVQLSADGAAMVFHDYGLARLAHARGPVRKRRADALRRVSLRGSTEGIPDLSEVMALVAGRVPVLIEIKDQSGDMGPNIGPLEEAVAQALAGYVGDVAVMSFNPHSVARMAQLCPQIPRGITTSAFRPGDWPLSKETCDHLRAIPDYDRVGASFISHEADDLDCPRVAELRRAGAVICCWTVRSAAAEATARRIAHTITFEGYAPAA